jgi:hypothetical protein
MTLSALTIYAERLRAGCRVRPGAGSGRLWLITGQWAGSGDDHAVADDETAWNDG